MKKKVRKALTLDSQKKVVKKTTKDYSTIETAVNQIHEKNSNSKSKKNKEDVKKTSLHLPMSLYTVLKIEAFQKGITLRELIISTLNEKFTPTKL